MKRSDLSFLIVEDGFEKARFEVGLVSLKKVLKGLLKKEFPRSHKVRLYSMGEYNEKEAKEVVRKKI